MILDRIAGAAPDRVPLDVLIKQANEAKVFWAMQAAQSEAVKAPDLQRTVTVAAASHVAVTGELSPAFAVA